MTFPFSAASEPHRDRRRAILQQHPAVGALLGTNAHTLWCILAVVALQVAVAAWVRNASWLLVVLLAYAFGAFLAHAGFVLMHECAHGLVFRRRVPDALAGILANLPNVIPSSASVQRYHLRHHGFQGVHELDVDMPSVWEARVVGTRVWRKALWLLLFPLLMSLRPAQLKEIRWLSGWNIVNLTIVVAFDVAVAVVLGPQALAYLVLSVFFGMGLHPLGGRWIQEHFILHPPQETYSYYGPLNLVSFNIGYHNEHHDFPGVPWNRLPRVRLLAPEWYQTQTAYWSWTGLVVRFLFDPGITLFSRMRRTNRGTAQAVSAAR